MSRKTYAKEKSWKDHVAFTAQAIKQAFLRLGLVTLLIFVVLYILTNQLFFTYHLYAIIGIPLATLITSPFNASEAASGFYASTSSGLVNNFVAVAIILWLAELYARHFAIKLKRLSPFAIFLYAILASYIFAIILFVITGKPSTGTSIIGFSITGFVLVSILFDLKYRLGIALNKGGNFWRVYSMAVSTIIAVVVLLTYLVGNPSWWVHLCGGAVFGLIVFAALYLDARSMTPAKEAENASKRVKA